MNERRIPPVRRLVATIVTIGVITAACSGDDEVASGDDDVAQAAASGDDSPTATTTPPETDIVVADGDPLEFVNLANAIVVAGETPLDIAGFDIDRYNDDEKRTLYDLLTGLLSGRDEPWTATSDEKYAYDVLNAWAIEEEGLMRDTDSEEFAFGFDIRVTADGPIPRRLWTLEFQEVRFTNETDEAIEIVFVNGPADRQGTESIEALAPGETGSFVSSAIRRIQYTVSNVPDQQFQIDVDQDSDISSERRSEMIQELLETGTVTTVAPGLAPPSPEG